MYPNLNPNPNPNPNHNPNPNPNPNPNLTLTLTLRLVGCVVYSKVMPNRSIYIVSVEYWSKLQVEPNEQVQIRGFF